MALKNATTQEAATALIRDGLKWGNWLPETGATVTYGFIGDGYGNIAMTADDIARVEYALDLWADVANIKFERNDGPNVQIAFTNYNDPSDPAGGEASGSVGSYETVRINLASQVTASDDARLETVLHEIGHALGLSHPGNYDSRNADAPTYADDAAYRQDTKQYSIMSYFSASNSGGEHGSVLPVTPLLHDIAAIQGLYGINTQTRTGDTTYGFNSNADRMVFHIDSPYDSPVFAIWDAGGTDTLDLSGYSADAVIDLNPEAFSSAGGLRYNIAIAKGVYIENAKGGSGNDIIIGNQLANTLYGGDGNDIIDGRAGGDRMIGGLGNDTYYVDNWSDEVIDQQLVRISLTGSWTAINAGSDRVITTLNTYTLPKLIENLSFGGSGNFTGYGNALDNEFVGSKGNDTFFGYDGNDTFYGLQGSDFMSGGAGDDTYIVNDIGDVVSERLVQTKFGQMYVTDAGGIDTVKTTLAQYTLGMYVENLKFIGDGTAFVGTGNNYDNFIEGGSLGDKLVGMGGNDTLDGKGGADDLNGGAGDDVYIVDDVGDVVSERVRTSILSRWTDAGGIDEVQTSLNSYTLGVYVENLTFTGNGPFAGIGNNLDNTIYGGRSADILKGGAGHDLLVGQLGDDLLYGGSGHDSLVGGWQDDTLYIDNGDQTRGDIAIGGEGFDTIVADPSMGTAGLRLDLYSLEDTQPATFKPLTSLAQSVERVYGGLGGDSIDASRLHSDENVRIDGKEGDDHIVGGEGNDVLVGGIGADNLFGGAGDDVLVVDSFDTINGGTGYDYARADEMSAGLKFNVVQSSIEFVDGSKAADAFTAGSASLDFVEINGNAGDDTLIGGDGEEWFDGGEGLDTMVFSGNYGEYTLFENFGGWAGWTMILNNATGIVDWTMRAETLQFADQMIKDPTLSSYIGGTTEADTLIGTDGMDVLAGGDGADVLVAGGGADALYIDNFDTLIDGGDGLDVVYVNESANQSGLNFTMAGTNIEHVWSGMGNDTIDARGLTLEPDKWYAVTSHAGDDLVFAGGSNLSFDGGVGEDTLVLAGNGGDYSFTFPAAGVTGLDATITHTASGAVNYVLSVENFEFADGTVTYSDLFA